MYSKTVTVLNEQGMHMRPAQLLADKAGQFTSNITLRSGEDEEIDVKSILGLLALGLEKGTSVTLTAEGEDEQQAVETLAQLFEQGFGE
ncbi:phosphocarrier protein [Paenibacillus sp. yr247]|uniref:HPr family phosphocarrier protein n=1 Tax=Paenibacillus sp. yr247 TaxID=1761880 RepID=UPI0008836271|nr:HPr family phosphocarrier protein [Paenibacillus sp. yr247]SDO23437.1 phosphocarrier protein [Paenibacillus sp. yr247]